MPELAPVTRIDLSTKLRGDIVSVVQGSLDIEGVWGWVDSWVGPYEERNSSKSVSTSWKEIEHRSIAPENRQQLWILEILGSASIITIITSKSDSPLTFFSIDSVERTRQSFVA